jgi:hypothetical protein
MQGSKQQILPDTVGKVSIDDEGFLTLSARCRSMTKASPLCRQGVRNCGKLLHFVGKVSATAESFSTSSARCPQLRKAFSQLALAKV